MGRIPEEVVAEVLERADMLQIVGEYVQLKRAGAHYKGLCPFHGEKTPSFNVNPDRGFFKCFGCGEGGDLYNFLCKIEGWTFPEAVRHVASRVGIEIAVEEDDAGAREKRAKKDAYLRATRLAQVWFEDQLWSGADEAPRSYLIERGVDVETARVFGLGYAPTGWSGLWDHLRAQGVRAEDAELAGLIIKGTKGWYDRFRGRVMFPVQDIWGEVLAFSGRIVVEDPERPGAKYINSPETPFYTKGRELFGLAATKGGIKAQGTALMVEGNFDVVALWARGVQNVVAPLGTALTERQVKLLARYTRKVHVCFDADKAGQAATMKALPALMENDFDARVVGLPAGDDPDSFVRREGKSALQERMERGVPLVAWAIDQLATGREGAPVEERVAVLGELAEVMGHVSDRITWLHYTREIARRLDIDPKQIAGYLKRPERLASARPAPGSGAVAPAAAPGVSGVHEGSGIAPEVGGLEGDQGGAGQASSSEAVSAPRRVEPRRISTLEAACLQVLSDSPPKLVEFVENGCCGLLRDHRLVTLVDRVCVQHRELGRPPEWSRAAERLAEEIGDRDFMEQVTGIFCAERAYSEDRLDQNYFDLITRLQSVWLEQEEAEVKRFAQEVSREGGDVLEVARRYQQMHEVRRALDLRLQKKKLDATERKSSRGARTLADVAEAGESPVEISDGEAPW